MLWVREAMRQLRIILPIHQFRRPSTRQQLAQSLDCEDCFALWNWRVAADARTGDPDFSDVPRRPNDFDAYLKHSMGLAPQIVAEIFRNRQA